jgi:hypothetical protein
MEELDAIAKLILPEGYSFGGFYLVNRMMEDVGWRNLMP